MNRNYTHRWSSGVITRADWQRLINDCWRIVAASKVKICNAVGEDLPGLSPNGSIGINGDASQGLQSDSFFLTRTGGSGFCKTSQQPYDEVVGAILLRASAIIPVFSFTSDGNVYGPEWQAARDLYNATFPAEVSNPDDLDRALVRQQVRRGLMDRPGYAWAIALLRDSQANARSSVDRAAMKLAADYLESKREQSDVIPS